MAISIEQFVESLVKTGIASRGEADSLLEKLPSLERVGDADRFARDLVRQGTLSRYQAAAIYQGKADGLVLGNYLILDRLGAGGMGQVFGPAIAAWIGSWL